MTNQQQAAVAAMTEWLAHPQELGKAPAKIEIAGEFDLHDCHYYILKYKKSLLGKWLVGVCGFEDAETLEPCGHTFSQMEPYDPADAQEKCQAMVEMIRQYWMDRAKEETERQSSAGPFAGFVLLSTPEWDLEAFKVQLKADWDIDYPPADGEQSGENDDKTVAVFDVDGMTAAGYVREKDPEVVIIFVTNLAQYAIQGYAVNALDYILKPLSYFSFSQRLNRALQFVRKREAGFLTVAVKGGAMKLEIDGIFFVERLGRQLMFHTRTGVYASTATLQQIEQELEGRGFARCNKGYLVNLEHVDGIQDGCAVVHGSRLLISRGRRAPFLEALADCVGGVSP